MKQPQKGRTSDYQLPYYNNTKKKRIRTFRVCL